MDSITISYHTLALIKLKPHATATYFAGRLQGSCLTMQGVLQQLARPTWSLRGSLDCLGNSCSMSKTAICAWGSLGCFSGCLRLERRARCPSVLRLLLDLALQLADGTFVLLCDTRLLLPPLLLPLRGWHLCLQHCSRPAGCMQNLGLSAAALGRTRPVTYWLQLRPLMVWFPHLQLVLCNYRNGVILSSFESAKLLYTASSRFRVAASRI